MTDEMRAEFEVAFRAQFGFGASDIHEAKDAEAAAMMGCALWAWEASREAVVVEIEQIRSEAKRQEDGLKEMLRRQNKQICALRGKP